MALTTINSDGVKDDSIVNADIKSDAAIAGSKIDPTFTTEASITQAITTQGNLLSLIPTSFGDEEKAFIAYKRGSVELGKIGVEADNAGQAGHLVFETATSGTPSEKVRIKNDGKVGIGTENPSAPLHIVGSDNTTTLLVESTDADANVGPIIELFRNSGSPADNDAIGRIDFKCDDDAGNASTFARIAVTALDVSNNSEDARIDFIAANNDTFTPTMSIAGGKVGIGTTSMSGQLNVQGSAGGVALQTTDATNSTFRISHPSAAVTLLSGGSSQHLALGTGFAEKMRIDSSGKVGIGTESPLTDAQLTLSEASDPALAFQRSGSGKFDAGILVSSGHFHFKGGADSTTVAGLNELVKIESTGNVNITDGNLVVANGHGIDFSAQTSTSASEAQVSGTGHEILTHYEEGQWTPRANGTGQSYDWAKGRYTRIGNTVFYWFDVSWTGMSSGMADGRITGLPFTSTAVTSQGGYGAVSFRAATGLETDIRVYGNSSYIASAYIQLQHYQSSGAVALTDFLANGRVTGEGFYFTNNAY